MLDKIFQKKTLTMSVSDIYLVYDNIEKRKFINTTIFDQWLSSEEEKEIDKKIL